MITLDYGTQEENFDTNIMAALKKQRELRLAGIASTLWNGVVPVRAIYKNMETGNWIVDTPEKTVEIVA